MNPKCIWCGKIISIKSGTTTEMTSNRPVFNSTTNKVYICKNCVVDNEERLERIKTAPWYVSCKTVQRGYLLNNLP